MPVIDGDGLYLVAGLALLLGAVLPRLLSRYAVSAPIAFLGGGLLLGLVVDRTHLSPLAEPELTKHLAELTVIIALMGVGLAIDRPVSLLQWRVTWRLLFVAMPAGVAALTGVGWLLGVAPVTALLIAAVLAPTDPVLASDVQVGGPTTGEDAELDEEDEVRFALTSEAGLNDGLAAPLVYLAVFLATKSFSPVEWVAWDLLGKTAIGVAVGFGAGWLLGRMTFSAPAQSLRLADSREPVLALAMTLGVYGLTEVLHGYGFIAVFVAALTLRSAERSHDFHNQLHDFIGQLEHILTWGILLLLGVAVTAGLLEPLDWAGVLIGVLLVAVVRPVIGRLSLIGTELSRTEAWATAAFGVRGVSSIYYLAAVGASFAADLPWLWATLGFTVVVSVVLHGVAATPVMRFLERRS
ncbi:sodium:proton antiporter [Kribbella sandramycini]|uniref:NhaP-type Na+/H+ or K+/H+ antiporter n=1 Tax=Kribbella sandramycini TaxID=60450 RepID=A0A7Y4L999_9ACTN|nr:cation:proton antiporter [Kribbella sandramycini]MBB6566770.1 NhaP-type Na+/H+ or K+/H+ antiporter [Kribbella sandramycini]NOL45556.1 sodium:proton antiporter [Kribbella sandramycini]